MRMNDQHDTSIVLRKPSRCDINHAPVQRLLRRERDRVEQEIEPAPLLLDTLEHLFGLPFGVHIQRHEDRRLELLRQRFDVLSRAFVEIGYRKLRAQRPERLRTPPSDRLIVGDADNETLSSLQRYLGFRKYWDGHDVLSRLKVGDELRFHSSDNVCCAIINSSSVGTM